MRSIGVALAVGLLQAIGATGVTGQQPETAISTDRPDFTDSPNTVGVGRVQIEAGATVYLDQPGETKQRIYSYPELLLRVGLVANWIELRFGATFVNTRESGRSGLLKNGNGFDDLYLGAKLGILKQRKLKPDLAVVFRTTIPMGHDDIGSPRLLPGFSVLYGWTVTPVLSLNASSVATGATGDFGTYAIFAQSLSAGWTITNALGAFTECFILVPAGSDAVGVRPQPFADGGFTYRVSRNFQLDVRVGFGLTEDAQDFFSGAGLAVRF